MSAPAPFPAPIPPSLTAGPLETRLHCSPTQRPARCLLPAHFALESPAYFVARRPGRRQGPGAVPSEQLVATASDTSPHFDSMTLERQGVFASSPDSSTSDGPVTTVAKRRHVERLQPPR